MTDTMSELNAAGLEAAREQWQKTAEEKRNWSDALTAAIRAYLRTTGEDSGAVAVKALEWASGPPYSVARVPDLHLLYSTECVWNDGKFDFCQLSGNCLNKVFPTLAAAKAAAQADFEARIRSALVASPSMADAVTEALIRDLMLLMESYTAYAGDAVPASLLTRSRDMHARLAALAAAPEGTGGAKWECASEGCRKTATVHFERGGVGSYYCHECYMRVQAIGSAS